MLNYTEDFRGEGELLSSYTGKFNSRIMNLQSEERKRLSAKEWAFNTGIARVTCHWGRRRVGTSSVLASCTVCALGDTGLISSLFTIFKAEKEGDGSWLSPS